MEYWKDRIIIWDINNRGKVNLLNLFRNKLSFTFDFKNWIKLIVNEMGNKRKRVSDKE